MKAYKYKNEIIREDELEEIRRPKVGDRFRVKRDRLCSAPMKSGDLITVKEIVGGSVIYDTHGWAFNVSEIGDGLEPIPSPPVCPPELLPLPEGAVYCGLKCGKSPRYMWMEGTKRWEGFAYDGNCSYHYATTAGDACHRSQPWFSEDQVPEPPTQYPPPESEWPEKPAPPEGCEWVRQEKVGRTEKGQQYLFLHRAGSGVWWCGEHRDSWSGTVVFRAVPIDHTEGGKYRMLEVGEIILDGDQAWDEETGEWYNCQLKGNRAGIYLKARRPVKSDLQQKFAELSDWKEQMLVVLEELDLQTIGDEIGVSLGGNISKAILPWIRQEKEKSRKLKILVDEIEKLNKSEA